MLDLNNLPKEEYETLLSYAKGEGCKGIGCYSCIFHNALSQCDIFSTKIERESFQRNKDNGGTLEHKVKLKSQKLLDEYLKRLIEC